MFGHWVKWALAMFVSVVLVACDTTAGAPGADGQPRGVSSRVLRDEAGVRFRHLDAVNALRQQRGLPALQYSRALNSAALTHARDMALQQRAWHFGSDRSNPQTRATRAGYGGLILGENISESFDDDLATLQAWMDNRDAGAVVLNPRAAAIGFAWFQESNGKVWWVQLIASSEAPGA